jgi:parvulin-like peptidyl-prolyl isomerase
MPTLTPEMKDRISEEVEKRIKSIRDNYSDEDAFKLELKKWELTPETLFQKMRMQETSRYIIGWGLGSMISLTSIQVKEYEKTLKDKGLPLQRFRLRHILIPIPKDAEAEEKSSANLQALDVGLKIIREQITFADAAREYSKGPGAKSSGGDIGYVNSTDLEPEILKILLRTRPGQITMPIETVSGYHIFMVEEKLDANDFLYQKKFRELQDHVIKDLKERVRVEVYEY